MIDHKARQRLYEEDKMKRMLEGVVQKGFEYQKPTDELIKESQKSSKGITGLLLMLINLVGNIFNIVKQTHVPSQESINELTTAIKQLTIEVKKSTKNK